MKTGVWGRIEGDEGAEMVGPRRISVREVIERLESGEAAVGEMTEADLDRPCAGSMATFAPTLGKLLILISNHTLMHGGQIQVIRRVLGKPILF